MNAITTDDNRQYIALSVSERADDCYALLAAELFPDGTFEIYPILQTRYVRQDQVSPCRNELCNRFLIELRAYRDRSDEQRMQKIREVVTKTSPLPESEEYRINGRII